MDQKFQRFGSSGEAMVNSESLPYYYIGDRKVRLFPHPTLIAVRLTKEARLDTHPASDKVRRALDKAEPLDFLPRDALQVYRTESAPEVAESLRREPGVASVVPVFQRTLDGADTLILTTRIVAQFRADLSDREIASVLETLGLRILELLSYASPHGFVLETVATEDGLSALKAANALVERGLVVFAEPDVIQSRHWRDGTSPNPTTAIFLDSQWHLKTVHALDAWKYTEGSASIRIAILDDGLDVAHAEFATIVSSGESKVSAQFDFATGTADASPKTYIDSHGTACAGVASSSGMKAAGVAPGCRLVVARTPNYLGVSDEAKMFVWAADVGADVISCSWGPMDGTGETVPLPTPTRLAIHYCLTNGRAGKGIPIFWAAGNGSESMSVDGYASNPEVMAIAACTAAESPAPYTDYGPEIFACAPSNGGLGQPAIFTTDRRGPAGYNPGISIRGDTEGDYTSSFGGTSAAAPLAAGIAALALSANPSLTAAQVRDLLGSTADRIGPPSAYDAGHHSDRYGYGRLNAAAAVEAARTFVPSAPGLPTIIGPTIWSRVDAPPTFQVGPSPHLYYVVEVATKADLFDAAHHGAERTDYNFYGSWSDTPFQTSPTYELPPGVWARVRLADRLWYRVGSSASASAYVDYLVSTPDDHGLEARSIAILSGIGAPPPSAATGRSAISDLAGWSRKSDEPSIDGPLCWNRSMGPPTLRLELCPDAACRVKLAVGSKKFEAESGTKEWPPVACFTSDWIKPAALGRVPQLGFQAYTLPMDAWKTVLHADRLYYWLAIDGKEPGDSAVLTMDLVGSVAWPWEKPEWPVRPDEKLWRVPQRH